MATTLSTKFPYGKFPYGKVLWMHRNTQTNQVVYTLRPELKDKDLKQLPFLGKRSVPANVRPDIWRPMCAVTFPSQRQGLHAFKKMRELRRLHEIAWDQTNPEWRSLEKEDRKKKIMDQRANAVVDLATTLRIQETTALQQRKWQAARTGVIKKAAKQTWTDITSLSQRAEAGEAARIEENLRTMEEQLERKQEKEKARITKAIPLLRKRLKKLLWAQRMLVARDTASAQLQAQKAAVDAVSGGQGQLTPNINHPIQNEVVRKLLHRDLQKPFSEPFVLDGIVVEWSDSNDAYYVDEWPAQISHDYFGFMASGKHARFVPGQPQGVFPITTEEIARQKAAEARGMEEGETEVETGQEQEKKGILQRLMFWRRSAPKQVDA